MHVRNIKCTYHVRGIYGIYTHVHVMHCRMHIYTHVCMCVCIYGCKYAYKVYNI